MIGSDDVLMYLADACTHSLVVRDRHNWINTNQCVSCEEWVLWMLWITVCVHAQLLSHAWLFETLKTIACQAPLSMGFSRQEYWRGWPLPSPGDLPKPRVKAESLVSPALADKFSTIEPHGKPLMDHSREAFMFNEVEGQCKEFSDKLSWSRCFVWLCDEEKIHQTGWSSITSRGESSSKDI